MKAVRLLIESRLPEELRDPDRQYTAKEVGQLLSDLAVHYPDQYDEINRLLADTGRNASYWQGETIGLDDLRPVFDKQPVLDQMKLELASLNRDDPEYKEKRESIWHRYNDQLQQLTSEAGRAGKNSIAQSVLSGARGKDQQLKMMITAPGLYQDSRGRTIPLFAQNSFSEGLRPAEFLAGTYGARTSVLATKRATAKGGDLGKMMVQASTPTVVTTSDCGTDSGIDLDVSDPSMKGRILAHPVGDIPAGTVVDRSVLRQLEDQKATRAVVRSALTCTADRGVCQHCVGKLYNQELPKIGQAVGITAAQSLSEPVAQGALSTKHTGGAAGAKKQYAGFDVISQLVQSPEEFPDRAAVSEVEGTVSQIEEAPQGGYVVTVGETQHYVPHGYPLRVEQGQQVEAGDQLSEGLVDAGDIVRLRGIGSGRRYFADRLHQVLGDSGFGNDRRNVEIFARGAIDHIRVEDDEALPGTLPDDQLSYNWAVGRYNPPTSTKRLRAADSVGKVLQAPALHYSIGTRLKPSQVKKLEENGYDQLYVADSEPGWQPEMQRLRTATQNNPDWLARMHTSYLKSNLQHAAVRGQDTDLKSNIHFAPRLAIGKDFGKDVSNTGEF